VLSKTVSKCKFYKALAKEIRAIRQILAKSDDQLAAPPKGFANQRKRRVGKGG